MRYQKKEEGSEKVIPTVATREISGQNKVCV